MIEFVQIHKKILIFLYDVCLSRVELSLNYNKSSKFVLNLKSIDLRNVVYYYLETFETLNIRG